MDPETYRRIAARLAQDTLYGESRIKLPWQTAVAFCCYDFETPAIREWLVETEIEHFVNNYGSAGFHFIEFAREQDAILFSFGWGVPLQ